jgi:hypothetical protein
MKPSLFAVRTDAGAFSYDSDDDVSDLPFALWPQILFE